MMYGKSRLSRHKQELEYFVNGSSARGVADLVGVNESTAAYSFHRLSAIIACQIKQEFHEVFGGGVDANYVGGYRKGNRGRGVGRKVAVFGLLKRVH